MANSDWQYLTTSRQGRVLTVSFDGKDRVNSMNNALMRELTQLAQSLRQDSSLSAVVLCGAGSTFSGGMNLKDPELLNAGKLSAAQKRVQVRVGPDMCAAWEALDQITIVAIEGWCVGGGVALSVACDWRVAANDSQLYVPELRLGMNMSWQSIPRIANLVGPARSKSLLILAEPLDALTAHSWGLVDYLAEPGAALARAQSLAAQVAAMPPVPVAMSKQAVNASCNALNDATSAMDLDQFLLMQESEDAAEGIRAFREKREPTFRGN
ncbi:MAG: enoyl-CoA hydratase [Halieaceae bacterium]|jgi:enoyl-CoA hydratase